MSHRGQRSTRAASVLWRVIRQQKADMGVGPKRAHRRALAQGRPPRRRVDRQKPSSCWSNENTTGSCSASLRWNGQQRQASVGSVLGAAIRRHKRRCEDLKEDPSTHERKEDHLRTSADLDLSGNSEVQLAHLVANRSLKALITESSRTRVRSPSAYLAAACSVTDS